MVSALDAIQEQQMYCVPSQLVEPVVVPVFAPNGASIHLGSSTSQEATSQRECRLFTTGSQASSEQTLGIIPCSTESEVTAGSVSLQSCRGILKNGDILLEGIPSQGLCLTQPVRVLSAYNSQLYEPQEKSREDLRDESSTCLDSNLLSETGACKGWACEAKATFSNLPAMENKEQLENATLSMRLTDVAEKEPVNPEKDFDFSSLVEMAKCIETCKHTGRKSGSSQFLGVSKHRKSGRFEAHVWMPKKSRQAYLGGFECAMAAACAYDVVAIKVKGMPTTTNFRKKLYSRHFDWIQSNSLEEVIAHVRRHSGGFSRGHSKYRGVTQHPNGRWEARIGVGIKSHVYLGLYDCQESAAKHYDEALVRLKGDAAATNFPLRNYPKQIEENHIGMKKSLLQGDRRTAEYRKSIVEWIKNGSRSQSSGDKPAAVEKS